MTLQAGRHSRHGLLKRAASQSWRRSALRLARHGWAGGAPTNCRLLPVPTCRPPAPCRLAVMSPFYALRYAGAAPMPAALQPGASVYSVDR